MYESGYSDVEHKHRSSASRPMNWKAVFQLNYSPFMIIVDHLSINMSSWILRDNFWRHEAINFI